MSIKCAGIAILPIVWHTHNFYFFVSSFKHYAAIEKKKVIGEMYDVYYFFFVKATYHDPNHTQMKPSIQIICK